MDSEQAKFEGWAIVDVLGHQRYVGHVTTQAFGGAVLFRIDVPALEERERTLKGPAYVTGEYAPAGSVVKEGATPGYTKLVGAGSIYTITPCTKEAAEAALEQAQSRPLMLVSKPPDRFQALQAPTPDDDDAPGDYVKCENCGRELSDEDVVRTTDDDVTLCDECWKALKPEMTTEGGR